MRSKDPRRSLARRTQIETLEDRVVMSADPLGGLLGSVSHHALADDPNAGAPIVEQHSVEQHQASEVPSLGQHGSGDSSSAPTLGHHGDRAADFWIDPRTDIGLDEQLSEIEQSLNSAHGQTGLDTVRADYGFRGGGQTVAVIDSGIAYTHYALGGGFGSGYRVVGGYDFTESGADALDPYDDGPNGGHGTHVSGIIGGDAGLNSGVAPDVDIVGLRVFDDAGAGLFSWVEEALDWVHANRNNFDNPITAVNLSLGTEYNSDSVPLWAMLEDEFAQLEADGIFIAVSAGNSFQNFNTPGLSYPAASPYVVPVMSTDDSGMLSYFSQRHQRAIAAPGRFITSTVPDYAAGDADTIDDDFASWSGTSMASPYVAGASVIIREAMEFVGTTNITQDLIYDHMMATADQFVDSATGLTYDRLNLEAAIDALMPTDDYGSTAGAASSLGNISGVSSVNGVIAKLDDADYFTFTADMTGTVEFTASATHDLDISWDGTGTVSGANGDVFTLDVVNGQTYTIGLSTGAGLGYYDLAVDTQSTFTFTEWGTVVFDQYNNVTGTGETWYHIVAGQGGFLTAEAFFSNAAGDVDLSLYDTSMQMQSSSSGFSDSERVNILANTGDEFYLRVTGTNADIDFQLTNLVAVDGSTLNITGTGGDDAFAFTAGSTHNVQINGVSYDLDPATISTVNFDGGAGSDSATLTGTSGDETAILRAGSATLLGAGFEVTALNVENVTTYGGGGDDRANFYDSVGNDRFIGRSTYAQMSGAGFINYAIGFDRVYAYATAGGADDRADFYDSAGDDRFVGKSTYAQMSGTGFFNYASGFDRVYAYATAGGADDRADFFDSSGDDRFVGKSTYAQMSGTGFFNYGSGFDRVYAYATAGGADDRAEFYDSSGDDRFVGKSTYAQMIGTGFFNYGSGFDRVYAYATAGGADDRADFYDSSGDDRFVGKSTYAQMSGTGFFNYGSGFDRVYAYATAGGADDRADFYDSAGNDRFYAWATYAQMLGDGFFTYGSGFDRVYAYATAGGVNDRAYLFGSAGADKFVSKITVSWMSSSDYFNHTSGFESVSAFAGAGGFDRAYLYDSSGDDTLVADDDLTVLSGIDHYTSAAGFAELVAYSILGGNDTSDVDVIDSVFTEIGDWDV